MLQVSCRCVIQVGIDANTWGDTSTESLYNFTFERYLNEQLSATTLCTFQMVLFTSIDAFVAAGISRSVDIYFAGPGVFVCLQVSYCHQICFAHVALSLLAQLS